MASFGWPLIELAAWKLVSDRIKMSIVTYTRDQKQALKGVLKRKYYENFEKIPIKQDE